jgi:hypothetical protein
VVPLCDRLEQHRRKSFYILDADRFNLTQDSVSLALFFDKGRFHYLKGLSITPGLCITEMHTAANQRYQVIENRQSKRHRINTQDAARKTKNQEEQFCDYAATHVG